MPDNPNRNTLIFVVLSMVLLFGYQALVLGPQNRQRDAELKARETPAAAQGATGAIAGAPALAGPAAPVFVTREAAMAGTPRIVVDTPALQGSVSLRGGRIDDLFLRDYREDVDPKSPPVELLRPEGVKDAWFADFGWTGSNLPGLPGATALWTQVQGDRLSPGRPVVLRYDAGQGLVFTRRIEVDDRFMFTVTDTVANSLPGPVTIAPYASVQRRGAPAVPAANAHEGTVGVMDGVLEMLKYKQLKKDGEKVFKATGGWLGVTDKYWLAAVVPEQKEAVNAAYRATSVSGLDIYEANFVANPRVVQPGGTYTHVSRLFAGAKTLPVLRAYETSLGIPRLQDAVDWGRLYFLTKPIFWLLEVFFGFLNNFGLAILALTVVIRLLLFYPANLSYESLTKMKKVQPQVEELRARLKDDPQRQQQELMRLYQSEKINPLMGCLPMLATIPVFLALFKVLSVSIEMRHAPFYGWIRDLSARDPTTIFNLFGLIPLDPATLPYIGGLLNGPLHIGIWPLAYGFTQWLSMKLSPPAPDPMQQRLMELMPVIFTFVMAPFAVGLMIYYTWSNVLTILQQYVIMRKYQVENPIDDFIAKLRARKAAG